MFVHANVVRFLRTNFLRCLSWNKYNCTTRLLCLMVANRCPATSSQSRNLDFLGLIMIRKFNTKIGTNRAQRFKQMRWHGTKIPSLLVPLCFSTRCIIWFEPD
ncbi:hypothetical protein O6H91_13G063500 [Diphasiastrum complanatum]|uniref:Uncharacterized protein n=1 Tax=Diphasiastrum complanatum TaxID=34168 RepID=A0ACC2BVD7_DIPCM|nr:hypothetical protein O6H91_13G063500 [Diphasiastrum complanatum]